MSELVYLPVKELYPHPDNPRDVVDDLEELTASIRENGVLQNLTVVKGHFFTLEEWQNQCKAEGVSKTESKAMYSEKCFYDSTNGYTVIIGHRRLEAAKAAGLETVPCVVAEMTEKEQLQTMIMENMQRKDLKVYEEAKVFQQMLDFGDTMEEVSQKSGFSVTTIKRRVKLNELDQKTLKKVVDSRLISLSDFEELGKIEDLKERNKALETIGTDNFTHCVKSALRTQAIKKVLPDVKQMIADYKMKEINSSDPYYNKAYKQIGNCTNFTAEDWPKKRDALLAEVKKKLAKNKGSKPCCVLNETWGEITLYVKTKEEKTVEEKEADAKARAVAKEAAEAWEELKRQCEEIRQLRKAFVDELKLTTKNKTVILQGALMAGLMDATLYNGGDSESVKAILNVDEHMEWKQREEAYVNRILEIDSKEWPRLVYYMFNDRKDRCLTTNDGYKKQMPEYRPQAKMLLLYDWLQKLGYKMSDKEKALVYGSDEIYEKTKAADPEPVPAGTAETDQAEQPGEV